MTRTNLGRIVPVHEGEHNSSIAYKRLSMVTKNGNTYTARKDVPSGTEYTNEEYWFKSADRDANFDRLDSEIAQQKEAIDGLETKHDTLYNNVYNYHNPTLYSTGSLNNTHKPFLKTNDSTGALTIFTRGEYANPNQEWSYYLLSVEIGTVSQIKGKDILLHFNESESNYKINSIKISKSPYNWTSQFTDHGISYSDPDLISWKRVDGDKLSSLATAHGWNDDTSLYLCFCKEQSYGISDSTIGSIKVEMGAMIIDRNKYSKPIVADFLRGYNNVNFIEEETFNTTINELTNDLVNVQESVKQLDTIGFVNKATSLHSFEGNSSKEFINPNIVRISYEVGQATNSVHYARFILCKIGQLKDNMVYIKTENLNKGVTTDSPSNGFSVGFSRTSAHQWGQIKYNVPFNLCFDGNWFNGNDIRQVLLNDGATDDSNCYVQLSNTTSYYPHTDYSCNKTMQVLVTNTASGVFVNASSLNGITRQDFDNIVGTINDILNSSNNNVKYITCWGDSLTAGGGWTSRLQELTGINVYNGGTGGENARCIMARQGADIMMVNNVTIPASNSEAVTIATKGVDGGISTQMGFKVTPLLQGGAHINPCKIGDITGTLKWTGENYADTNGTWTFTRTTSGNEVVINRPTAIQTDFDMNKNAPHLMILFIGQNGGYANDAELIKMHRQMIEHSKCKHYIVLGLSSGTASSRSAYETAMREEFGRYFVSLREYLSTYGMDDAGLTPTEEDLQMMSEGKTPQSLLSDAVHFTTACKTVIGNMLYSVTKQLGIF